MINTLCYGGCLRSLRKNRNLTISELSKAIGISSQYLSEIERGGRKCLNEEKTAALRDVLDLNENEYSTLLSLADKVSKRVTIPADVRAYIEENPYIIEEVMLAMENKLKIKACA